ncbi:MAG: ABC transporter substrate-binding protein [Acidobacteria bacterium]|nr:ABC transporter substrate-binding protein [Acidobacteriota bacterium]
MRSAWLHNKSLFLLLVALVAGGTAIPGYAQQNFVPLPFNPTVSIYVLPYLVAHEEGIFKKNGIDLRPSIQPALVRRVKSSGIMIPPDRVGASGGAIAAPMFAGDATGGSNPLTIAGAAPGIRSASTSPRPRAKDKTVIIASHYDHTHWLLMARKGITKPEQLKGKRIGYSRVGTISHFMALVFAKKMRWDPIQDISLISDSIDVDNLRDGLVDAMFCPEIVSIKAKAEGFSQVLDMRDKPWREPMASNSLHADRAWLRNNQETARRFLKSVLEGIALMKKDKAATVRAMVKWYNWTDPQEQDLLYSYAAEYTRKPYPAVEGIKKTMEVYDSLAMRKFKPEDFYDDSLMRELDQSGFIDGLYK